MNFPRASFVVLAVLILHLNHQNAAAQFSWDGDCGFNWADCCNFGTEQNPEWHNNWTIAPSTTGCPNLPGSEDHVYASTTVMLAQPYQTYVKSLNVAGTFMLLSELDIADEFSLNGSIFEPTSFLIQNGPVSTLELHGENATATISSFATLEFQFDGSVSGGPGALLVNNGLIWKTGDTPGDPPYDYDSFLNIPVENHGTISAWQGTIVLGMDSSSDGVIEALGDASVQFRGPANFVLDGEVRGDGLIRFLSTYTGGGTTVTGNYHPTNTLIAGGYATVNFEVDTSIENLTLDNPGIVGGSADLTIDDLIWVSPSYMTPGGTTVVQDTALIQSGYWNPGPVSLNRDLELHGQTIIDVNGGFSMVDSELRNYGDVEMHGNSSIVSNPPSAVVQNVGTLSKTSGAPSLINAVFLNIGEVAVQSGTLNFDGEMTSDGPITVNAGATLGMGHKQQTNFLSGSITGEGNVWFYNDFYSGDDTVDSILGIYDVGSTTIQAGVVDFQTDGVIAPQKTTGTLNMIQGFGATKLIGDADLIVTDQFNWNSGEMAGTGTTFVHGPMILTFVGYPQYLNRTLELNVDAPPGKQPPTSTLWINPEGTLRCKYVTIDGSVNNSGVISPGTPIAPIGQLHLTGGYTQTVGGQLTLNKLGPVHDKLIVDGLATLSGTLNAIGFPAAGGQSFTILTAAHVDGTFAQVNAPSGMEVVYTATSVILQAAPGTPCPADIAPGNGNGFVNVDDLLAVINSWGACANPNACPADIAPSGPPQGDDAVNVDDLLAVINAWGPCP